MGSTLKITTPRDYDLTRDVCSYGYFVLAPNLWDTNKHTLTRPLHLEDGPATVVLRQESKGTLKASFDRTLSAAERAEAKGLITRMLRLNEDETHSKGFHSADPRWKKSGRARLFEAADIAAKIMAGMGLSADDLGNAVDVMAKAMTTANTDLTMLGDAFKFVGPMAKTAGSA